MKPTRNEIIKQNIIDHLIWNSSVNANNVHVSVMDGKVELTGHVQNMPEKIAAERSVHEIDGVMEVENRLQIHFPTGFALPNDTELRIKVENILSWNQDLRSDHIEVHCKNSVVTLSGKVDSYREKHLAPRLIEALAGILEVKNQLKVAPIRNVLDEHIYEQIQKAFKRTYLIDEEKISVVVENGELTLRGKVDNFFVKNQALNMASNTWGVREVKDELSIK